MATIRIFKHYIPTQFLLLGLLEVVLLIIAFHIGVELRFLEATPAVREHVQPLFPKSITFALVVVLTMIGLGLYQRSLREGMEAMTLRLGASFLVSIVPLTLLYYLFPGLYRVVVPCPWPCWWRCRCCCRCVSASSGSLTRICSSAACWYWGPERRRA